MRSSEPTREPHPISPPFYIFGLNWFISWAELTYQKWLEQKCSVLVKIHKWTEHCQGETHAICLFAGSNQQGQERLLSSEAGLLSKHKDQTSNLSIHMKARHSSCNPAQRAAETGGWLWLAGCQPSRKQGTPGSVRDPAAKVQGRVITFRVRREELLPRDKDKRTNCSNLERKSRTKQLKFHTQWDYPWNKGEGNTNLSW